MIKDFNKIAIIAGKREISYKEMLQRISLYANHSPKEQGSKTIIFSENREGWIYSFFSIWANNGIAVPVDASSTVEDLVYIINDCAPQCVWTSRIKVDIVNAALKETGKAVDVLIIDDYEQAETTADVAKIVVDDNDTALIIYTSGTTGSPKGVMLSFQNLYTNIRSVSEDVKIFNETTRTLILLPLHHVLPLMGTVVIPLLTGGGVAICPSMSGPDIMETLSRGKISIIIGVPRLWQTLYGGIKKKIDSSAVAHMLFNICSKIHNQRLSRIIFKSVHTKLGGNLKFCVSGGAALDKEIGKGLRTLGIDVLEGYGMTEAAPMIAFTRPGDIIPGCVGKALPLVECKLIEGELCAKGPNIMQGYYNRPEETNAVIDKDGYLHTGDLARFDENGRIYITGRNKEIIVLSNGKNVQPNEIEYKLEKYTQKVKEAAVVQDGDLLRAIIVPQPLWAKDLTDEAVEEELKRSVLEPYNLTVANYKKLMSVYVFRGELPRTKLDKLQRFKLNDILRNDYHKTKSQPIIVEPTFEEYQIIKNYIEEEKKIHIKPTDHIETDLAMDSLDKVGLQGFIENTFGMLMKADTMAAFKDIKAMAEKVADSKTRMKVLNMDWHKLLNQATHMQKLPKSTFFYPLWNRGFKLFFNCYNHLKIIGKENIPLKGPFIIASNHQSFLDGPLATAGLKWKTIANTYFYAKEAHVKSKFRKSLAENNNIILMDISDLQNSILKLSEVLKQGKNIIIFPEGSRSHTGHTSEFKKTFAILSKELNVPILPVCIRGAFEALPRNKRFIQPHEITLEYLPLIVPSNNSTYESLTAETKAAIDGKLGN